LSTMIIWIWLCISWQGKSSHKATKKSMIPKIYVQRIVGAALYIPFCRANHIVVSRSQTLSLLPGESLATRDYPHCRCHSIKVHLPFPFANPLSIAVHRTLSHVRDTTVKLTHNCQCSKDDLHDTLPERDDGDARLGPEQTHCNLSSSSRHCISHSPLLRSGSERLDQCTSGMQACSLANRFPGLPPILPHVDGNTYVTCTLM